MNVVPPRYRQKSMQLRTVGRSQGFPKNMKRVARQMHFNPRSLSSRSTQRRAEALAPQPRESHTVLSSAPTPVAYAGACNSRKQCSHTNTRILTPANSRTLPHTSDVHHRFTPPYSVHCSFIYSASTKQPAYPGRADETTWHWHRPDPRSRR